MDIEEYGKSVLAGRSAEDLKKVINSEAGAKLAARFDGTALEEAARRGDGKALSELLRNVLSTEEGRSFAAQIKKAVEKNGQ